MEQQIRTHRTNYYAKAEKLLGKNASPRELYKVENMLRVNSFENADWAENLLDYRFVVRSSADDKVLARTLLWVGIFYVDLNDNIGCCPAYLNNQKKILYLTQHDVNKNWKHIMENIVYVQINPPYGVAPVAEKDVIRPKVELDYLQTEKNKAFMKDDTIHFRIRPQAADSKAVKKKMVKKLKKSGEVKSDFRCSCQESLRIACNPAENMIPFVYKFLKKGNISDCRIDDLVLNHNCKFVADSELNYVLFMTCNEDTWEILRKRDGTYQLWHNNYERIDDDTREITEGFHHQRTNGNSLWAVLSYARDYRWSKHLEVERVKREIQEHERLALEEQQREERRTKYWWYRTYRNFKEGLCGILRIGAKGI